MVFYIRLNGDEFFLKRMFNGVFRPTLAFERVSRLGDQFLISLERAPVLVSN